MPTQVTPDAPTASMADDVFYILQKCATRTLSIGSVQCVCAGLNHVNNLLGECPAPVSFVKVSTVVASRNSAPLARRRIIVRDSIGWCSYSCCQSHILQAM